MYEEPPTPARPAHPPRGQRCPACGHVEADPWARFCGVCGSAMAGAAPAIGGPAAPPYPARPAAAPPAYVPGPGVPSGGPAGPGQLPQPIVYTVPSVGFAGPARIGAAVTAAFMLLPCVLFAFLGAWAVHAARRTMDGWLNASVRVPVPVVSVDLPMNFVDLLRMRPIYDTLVYWDDRLWLTFAILWLLPWFVWIVAGALFALVLAVIYNMVGGLGGGIRLTLTPTSGQAAAAPPPAWSPNPPPGSATAWPGQDWPREGRR